MKLEWDSIRYGVVQEAYKTVFCMTSMTVFCVLYDKLLSKIKKNKFLHLFAHILNEFIEREVGIDTGLIG